MFNKRINIFTGHFGSGKTEVAVNFTLKLAEEYKKVAIVDLDIVNPYFRAADVKTQMEEKGIYVVTPMYANTNIDVPALSSEINTVFQEKEYRAVFDVGGDDLGARVLSRYHEDILKDDYELFLVINTRRPETDNQEKIEEMIHLIESSARLKVTSFINNTNLLNDTTLEQVKKGHELIEKISKKNNIPIAYVSGFHESLQGIDDNFNTEILFLNKLIKLPWD